MKFIIVQLLETLNDMGSGEEIAKLISIWTQIEHNLISKWWLWEANGGRTKVEVDELRA